MKSLLVTAIGCALLGSVGGAVAADLPYRVAPAPALYPPVPSWTGFYVGANGGWQWSKADVTFDPFGGSSLFDFGSQTISRQTTGAVFGGQAGYNWQLSPTWVVGIEGDVDGSGAATSRNVVTPSGLAITGSDGFGASNRLEWLNSVRGRLGYVWGSGLLYFTGGGAWASFRHDAILSTNAGGLFGNSATSSVSSTVSGFVIGGGYEWLVTDHWTVRGEYLYYNFSNSNHNTLNFPVCLGGGTCGANLAFGSANVSVARLGVNYKF